MVAAAVAALSSQFRADLGQLTEIDGRMKEAGVTLQLAPPALFQARLVVAELATNIIEHGGPDPQKDVIGVSLRLAGDALAGTLRDTTRPFDLTAPGRPAKEAGEDGGFGLGLVKHYAKTLAYTRNGDYNQIELTIPNVQ